MPNSVAEKRLDGSDLRDGNVTAIVFCKANPSLSYDDAMDVSAVGVAAATTVVMPASGWIVGLSVQSNATAAAKSLATFTPKIAGSAVTDPVATIAAGATSGYDVATSRGVASFGAGDTLGVHLLTNADWAATDDVLAVVFVAFDRIVTS